MSGERQPCTICGGELHQNGRQHVDGRLRQFYRCTDCRQGGWINLTPTGNATNVDDGHGPVFEGLHGRMANEIARNHAAEVRA